MADSESRTRTSQAALAEHADFDATALLLCHLNRAPVDPLHDELKGPLGARHTSLNVSPRSLRVAPGGGTAATAPSASKPAVYSRPVRAAKPQSPARCEQGLWFASPSHSQHSASPPSKVDAHKVLWGMQQVDSTVELIVLRERRRLPPLVSSKSAPVMDKLSSNAVSEGLSLRSPVKGQRIGPPLPPPLRQTTLPPNPANQRPRSANRQPTFHRLAMANDILPQRALAERKEVFLAGSEAVMRRRKDKEAARVRAEEEQPRAMQKRRKSFRMVGAGGVARPSSMMSPRQRAHADVHRRSSMMSVDQAAKALLEMQMAKQGPQDTSASQAGAVASGV
eukprot:1179089-Prymnesium_polylepis.1